MNDGLVTRDEDGLFISVRITRRWFILVGRWRKRG